MFGEAPAIEQDQPARSSLDTLLANAGVPRSLSPELLQFAREKDLRLDGEETAVEDPTDENPETGQPGGEEEPSATLDDFDPTQIPEDADRDWLAQRHQQLVADYTKKTQGTAAERQETEEARRIVAALEDPRTAPAMLAAMGYEFEEDDDEDGPEIGSEYDDPRDAEIATLKQRLDQRDQREALTLQEEEQNELLAEEMEAIEKAESKEFSPATVKFLTRQAHASGAPMESVYAEFKEILAEDREAWKKSRKAPRRVSPGSPGSKTVDLTDQKQRRAAMAQAAEEATAGASSD
jgi:hypothetical protein